MRLRLGGTGVDPAVISHGFDLLGGLGEVTVQLHSCCSRCLPCCLLVTTQYKVGMLLFIQTCIGYCSAFTRHCHYTTLRWWCHYTITDWDGLQNGLVDARRSSDILASIESNLDTLTAAASEQDEGISAESNMSLDALSKGMRMLSGIGSEPTMLRRNSSLLDEATICAGHLRTLVSRDLHRLLSCTCSDSCFHSAVTFTATTVCERRRQSERQSNSKRGEETIA